MRLFFSFVLLLGVMPSALLAQNKAASTAAAELPPLEHFDATIVDRNLDPCVDFYKFACSKWQAANPIPADQPTWGTGSNLRLWNESVLRNTMTQASEPSAGRSPVDQKIGDYWYSCMDESVIDKAGIAPLKPTLAEIADLQNKAQIARVLAQIHMGLPGSWAGGDNETVAPMFGFSSTVDLNDATLVVAGIDQGGFALGGRDYYLSDNAKLVEVRNKYLEHVQKIFMLAGEDEAKAKADAATVLRMETAMAKAAMDSVKRRDPRNLNNVMTLQQVQALTPSFKWDDYLATVQAPTPKHYLVTSPDFFRGLETLLQERFAAGLEDLSELLGHRSECPLPQPALPGGELRVLEQDDRWLAADPAALAPLRTLGRPRLRRSLGRGLRNQGLPAGEQGARGEAGECR